jgi:cob(I)alamin adenosyltransferase
VTSPADTIREAWRFIPHASELTRDERAILRAAEAALTELEQQLAANTATANWEVIARAERHRAEAAEADRDRYREALEQASGFLWAKQAGNAAAVVDAALAAPDTPPDA